MNYKILKAELTDDPLARGYAQMSDVEAAADLNTVNRSLNRSAMSGSEILEAIDGTEWDGLTDAKKAQVMGLCGIGDLNPFGKAATLLTNIFGAGATITALAAARVETVSRGVELGLGVVLPGHVENARY